MFRISFAFIRKAIMIVALLGATNSQAGLIVVGGELVGATDVVVSGFGTYDVSFQDGSCASVFSGCDDISDFAFNDFDQTFAAGQALLEQVFVDSASGLFDSNPALIAGCESAIECIAFIPNKLTVDWVFSQNIVNSSNEQDDRISFNSNLGHDQSITDRANTTFAVFTQVTAVPTPATAWLFGLALIGFASRKYKK